MEIDLRKLAHILAVADIRIFSRAAETLRISQPALSRSIALTERRFGVTIFERGPGGVAITPQGEAIVEEATALMRRARDLEHNLLLYGRGEAGRFRFGMAPIIASIMLSKLGLQLIRDRPKMSIHVEIKPPADLIEDVRADRIEMAIVPAISIRNRDDFSIDRLGRLDICIAVRSGHPLTGKSGIVMADLWRYPIVCGSEIHLPEQNAGLFVCSNFHIVREIVLESDHVWFTSSLMLDAGQDPALRHLPVTDISQELMAATIVRRRYRRASPTAAYLMDAAAKAFPQQG